MQALEAFLNFLNLSSAFLKFRWEIREENYLGLIKENHIECSHPSQYIFFVCIIQMYEMGHGSSLELMVR